MLRIEADYWRIYFANNVKNVYNSTSTTFWENILQKPAHYGNRGDIILCTHIILLEHDWHARCAKQLMKTRTLT